MFCKRKAITISEVLLTVTKMSESIDLTVPPKENLIEQYMAARRDIDSRRQPHKLDTEMITRDMDKVIEFCKNLREKCEATRIEVVQAEFSSLVDRGFKTLVTAAAKCQNAEQFYHFESMFKMMISKIYAVQNQTLSMADATDSVSEVLETNFVKPVDKKQ